MRKKFWVSFIFLLIVSSCPALSQSMVDIEGISSILSNEREYIAEFRGAWSLNSKINLVNEPFTKQTSGILICKLVHRTEGDSIDILVELYDGEYEDDDVFFILFSNVSISSPELNENENRVFKIPNALTGILKVINYHQVNEKHYEYEKDVSGELEIVGNSTLWDPELQTIGLKLYIDGQQYADAELSRYEANKFTLLIFFLFMMFVEEIKTFGSMKLIVHCIFDPTMAPKLSLVTQVLILIWDMAVIMLVQPSLAKFGNVIIWIPLALFCLAMIILDLVLILQIFQKNISDRFPHTIRYHALYA